MCRIVLVVLPPDAAERFLTYSDVTTSRQSKQAYSALDFRNVEVIGGGEGSVGWYHRARGWALVLFVIISPMI